MECKKEDKDNFYEELLYAYLYDIKDLKPLSREEEIELFKRIKLGDEEARQEIILHNLRFVVYLSRKYAYLGLDVMDIISDGNEGLIQAVDNYDASLGTRFTTFASGYIKGYILADLKRNSKITRLPCDIYNNILKYMKIEEEKREKYGIEDISRILNITENEAKYIFMYSQSPISLNSYTEEIQNETESVEDNKISMEDKVFLEDLKHQIEILKEEAKLRENERKVIELVINNPDITFIEIGRMLNFSYENARRLYCQALYRLRKCRYVDTLIDYSSSPDESIRNIKYCRRKYLDDYNNRFKFLLDKVE